MKIAHARSSSVRWLVLVAAVAWGLGAAACQPLPFATPGSGIALNVGSVNLSAPTLVADIGPATESPVGAPSAFTAVGADVYFTVDPPGGGRALWRSSASGIAAVAELLDKDDRPTAPAQIVPFRAGVAVALTTQDELRVVVSDGTAAGTVPVAAVPHDPYGALRAGLVAAGDGLFFTNSPGAAAGSVLWYSPGGGEPREVRTFAGNGGIARLTALGDLAYIAGGDSSDSNRVELWRSDGTPAGTLRFLDRHILSTEPVADRLFVFTSSFPADPVEEELWVIDEGSEPRLVAAVPGGEAAAAIGERLFFASRRYRGDTSLYVSDGTSAGTRPIKESVAAHGDGYVEELVAVGQRIFLVIKGFEQPHELWVSDGTAAGTRLVRTFEPAVADNAPYGLALLGERVVFAADDGTTGMELWASDGTAEGTRPISAIGDGPADGVPSNPAALYAYTDRPPAQPFQAAAAGDRLLFPGSDGAEGFTLWQSDGTPDGTQSFGAATGGVVSGDPQLLRAVGERVLFFADDGEVGRELWASGGTPDTTMVLRDLNPGPEGSLPDVLTMQAFWQTPQVVGDKLYLVADTEDGRRLWQSDGTPGGTELLTDEASFVTALGAEGDGATAFGYLSAGGAVYSYQNGDGLELWRSDGTEAGAARVGDVVISSNPLASAYGPPPPPVVLAGRLYFRAEDDAHGEELWVSDGTAAGTKLLADLNPGQTGGNPMALTVTGDTVFFIADDGAHGYELWASDGTAEGTRMVRDIKPGATQTGPGGLVEKQTNGPCMLGMFHAAQMAAIGDTLYFLADNGATGCELWASDGTEAGTRLVRDIRPGPESGIMDCQVERSLVVGPQLIPLGDEFLFVADDGVTGCELWASDGTEAGTRQVVDLWPGAQGGVSGELLAVGGVVLMAASDGKSGVELWASDGTAAGTKLLADLRPGPASSAPANLTLAGERVFFTADDGVHGVELWASEYRVGAPLP